MLNDLPCPVCGVICHPLDVVDFNKSCVEESGNFLPLSGIPIYYYLCAQCNFCFAPEMYKWALDEFSQKVYNPGYAEIDPHYETIRPQVNADNINNIFGDKKYKKKFKKLKNIDIGLEKSLYKLNRQFLHAKTLGFVHPKSGKELEFSSILPQDLENILKMLRNISK